MNVLRTMMSSGRRRRLTGPIRHLIRPFAALIAVGVVYATTITYVDIFAMTIAFLCAVLALVFPTVGGGPDADEERPSALDFVLSVAALAAGIYFWIESERIITRITLLDELTGPDIFFGSIIVLLTMEATRRTVGLGLTAIVAIFMAYNLFGHAIPGVLGHGYISYQHFLDIMVFTTDGIFGVPIKVAATYAFLFVMFGTFLAKAGGADFFFDVAAAISGRTAGGPAKVAVISSGLYGTLSGSPTSDVVTTGSVTIPIMKRLGYSASLAGAVEVAASTGGSILPPVMGSAAFIMAEFTGIDYREIVIAAIIPALLYYFCVYLQVHLRSLKLGLRGLDETPDLRKTMRNGALFLVPLVVLTIALLLGYSPTFVAAFGALSVIVVSMLRKSTRMSIPAIYDALAETTVRMIPVVGACAAAGLVIGGLSMTGLDRKFADLVFLLAGNHTFVALVIAAALTILLGMGMPTPSAYILAAVLVGPTLTDMGFSVMASSLFLVYYASLSAMTPPIAVAAFAAAAIADANPLSIAAQAVRLSISAFIVPFAFIYGNGLLMIGTPVEIAFAACTAAVGVAVLVVGVEGYLSQPITLPARLLLIAAGLCLIVPSVEAAAAAVILMAAALALSPALRQEMARIARVPMARQRTE